MDKKEIAKILLDVNAITLRPDNPFVFASGIKSPIYCDNRLLMGHLVERRKITDAFEDLIEENGLQFDVLAGVATAGIPHAAWLADRENAPLIYVRKAEKTHGKENRIEGLLEKGKKVLVVEDLITSGGSSADSVLAVKDAGGIVENCIAIFTYGFKKAQDKFKEINCNLYTLTDFETLIEAAEEDGKIRKEQREEVLKWKENPEEWKK